MTLTYTNPVWDGYLADPFVLKWKGIYYAYGTGGPIDYGRQPDGRFLPLLRSHDMAHWEYLGGALLPLDTEIRYAYWAPEVAARDGRFYLYYSAAPIEGEEHRLRVAIADQPEGPFEDAGVFVVPDEPFTIDAHPFCDPADGAWYLFFAKDFFDARVGTALVAAPLADDMRSLSGPIQTILRASADWQIFERNRSLYNQIWDAWHTVEGPFVVVHSGRYYCLYSGGRWESEEYGVGFAVADSVLGPYTEPEHSGPRVLRGVADHVPGPGHNSVVSGPEDTLEFVVYHAWDLERTRRRMCIDPLIWTDDGPRCAGPTWTPQPLPEAHSEKDEGRTQE